MTSVGAAVRPEEILRLEEGRLVLLDHRRLPDEEVELVCVSAAEVAGAIQTLAVRGAPTIGIAAAYDYALAASAGDDLDGARRPPSSVRGVAETPRASDGVARTASVVRATR
jgi:methylthioribose-1-phosphate isomerase